MNKLEEALQKKKKIKIMTHVVVGYPSLNGTVELVELMEKSGVDMVELQIPFSDPLADGPTIMKACEQSLKNGTTVKDAFSVVRHLKRDGVAIPLLFMCYYNTVFRYGVEKFCKAAADVGISGLIVPDMPIDEEEEEHFYFFAKKYELHTIQVVSPVVTDNRLKEVVKMATGFVYCTARQGITGARNDLDAGLENYLDAVKKYCKVPLAVGFGISQKEHIEALMGKAEIAVIGSKILDIIQPSESYQKEVEHFIKQINVVK